jgi:hypothetical protein
VGGLLTVPKIDPLLPGARPVLISVSADPEKHVARSAITWTYRCGGDPPKQGGSAVFDSDGGTTAGQIDKDCKNAVVDIKASVDYANPRVTDLAYTESVPVTEAGVNHIFSVTAQKVTTLLYLDIRRGLGKKDHAVLAWQYQAKSEPLFAESGSEDLPLQQLLTAREYVLPIQLNIPVRSNSDGTVHVALTGVIGNKPVQWKQDFQPATPGILVQVNRDATVTTK